MVDLDALDIYWNVDEERIDIEINRDKYAEKHFIDEEDKFKLWEKVLEEKESAWDQQKNRRYIGMLWINVMRK